MILRIEFHLNSFALDLIILLRMDIKASADRASTSQLSSLPKPDRQSLQLICFKDSPITFTNRNLIPNPNLYVL